MSQKLLLGLVLGLTGVGAVICGVNLHNKIEREDNTDFNGADFE